MPILSDRAAAGFSARTRPFCKLWRMKSRKDSPSALSPHISDFLWINFAQDKHKRIRPDYDGEKWWRTRRIACKRALTPNYVARRFWDQKNHQKQLKNCANVLSGQHEDLLIPAGLCASPWEEEKLWYSTLPGQSDCLIAFKSFYALSLDPVTLRMNTALRLGLHFIWQSMPLTWGRNQIQVPGFFHEVLINASFSASVSLSSVFLFTSLSAPYIKLCYGSPSFFRIQSFNTRHGRLEITRRATERRSSVMFID